jgi:hypothetical protein
MPNPLIATVGLSAGSAVVQSSAAKKAASAQSASADAGIAEQRRQFDTVRKLLDPYVKAGTPALAQQQAALGLSGNAAQQSYIQGVEQSPMFGAMMQQGENAILQNASATGGLRGGNTQAALAQFRPQVLSQLLEQQYSQLGGLSAMGQNAAAGVGTAAQATGANVSGLMQQQGAAQAGGALAQGQAFGNVLGGVGGLLGRQLPQTGPIVPEGQTMFGRWGF